MTQICYPATSHPDYDPSCTRPVKWLELKALHSSRREPVVVTKTFPQGLHPRDYASLTLAWRTAFPGRDGWGIVMRAGVTRP